MCDHSTHSARCTFGGSIAGSSHSRTLFHGPFGAGQSARARDAACRASDAGARDVLFVVANGTARRSVISELVERKGAVFGVRAVTLQRLPLEIERRGRVKGADIATGVVEDVLMERAVREAARGTRAADASTAMTGLARAAAATIAEVEHGGGSRAALASALATIASPGDGAQLLVDAWTELERLHRPQTRSVTDAARSAIALLRTRDVLGHCSLIVLEDLPLSGPLDIELVSAMIAAAPCPIVATCEYASQLSAAPASLAYDRLRGLAQWTEQVCEHADDPLRGAATRVFEAPGDRNEPPENPSKPSLCITRLEAAGDAAEVRLAARVVLRHLRTADGARPLRLSDVLIVARGARYRELIREIFTNAGIAVGLPTRRSTRDTQLCSVLIELLELAIDSTGGTRERALALIRSPHLDVGMRAADRLERRVITHGYLGLEGWDALALRALGPRTGNRVNRLKRAVASARESLTAASSNEAMAAAVRHLAKELRLVGNAYFARRRVVRRHLDEALAVSLADSSVREDNQAWESVEQILDDVMPALLQADASFARERGAQYAAYWLSLFTRALSSDSPGTGRMEADLVRVTGASAGDGQTARVTIILGLQQKIFPRQPHQDPFLRDSVREQLMRHGIEMPTSEDAIERERESFVRAISTATEALYLSYPATDTDGKPTVTSFFVDDLQRATGAAYPFDVERLGVADVVPHPQDATSRAELLAAVAHGAWQRLPPSVAAEADRSACFAAWNTLLTSRQGVVPIATGRIAPAHPAFDAAAFAHAPHGTLELSASQLKTIQHCTFEHFVKKVLHPAGLVAPEYDALTKGSLIHSAMMRWVRVDGWHRGGEALRDLDDWFTKQAALLPAASRESPLSRFNIESDRERLIAFVRGELETMSAVGAARPAYNELAFGARVAEHGDRDPASLSTTLDIEVNTSLGARTVKFTGSVDRVDVYGNGDATMGIAIDYKTGRSSDFYAGSMADGTDLQLRLYLLALERLWSIEPAGALYIGFGDGVRRGIVREDAAEHLGPYDAKCITVLSTSDWNAFVHTETEQLIQPLIERVVTLDIVARPYARNCGFCDLGVICRYTPYDSAFDG